jgi:DNA-binding CsgD family transcriptional regulator
MAATPTVSGWDSLTDNERAVARLVSEGFTNPEIADQVRRSRHTVDFHLRQVYRKLEIDTRAELTRRALGGRPGETHGRGPA